jgi:hypothetical protein
MTAEDDELGVELRRLLADTRLEVPTRDGAEEAVVAGARRIRRRRAALATAGGALTAALLVAGSLALTELPSRPGQVALPVATAPATSAEPSSPAMSSATSAPEGAPPGVAESTGQAGTPSDQPPVRPSSSRSSAADSRSVDRGPLIMGAVLGPDGYGKLKLGMSFQEAAATGLLAGAGTPPSGCTVYRLSEGTSVISSVSISPTKGIVRFTAGGAHTPQGIKAGATLAQVRAAYPDLAKGSPGYTAPTGAGGSYVFLVDERDVVTTVELEGVAVTC